MAWQVRYRTVLTMCTFLQTFIDGGPGCSSMDGLWLENGPFRLIPPGDHNDDWEIKINPYSWHAAPAYTLYIDQPVGTGLSFTKKKNYCKTDEQIDIDFHLFLENFMLVHEKEFLIPPEGGEEEGQTDTQRKMSRPLYFSGESHAGHYIPSMMDHILKRNDDENSNSKPRVLMNLAGAAIGNGWTDPVYQYAAAEAAYGIGMIDLAQKEALDIEEEICQEQLRKGKFTSKQCDNLLNKVISGSHGASGKTKVSVYDNRKWESKSGERDFPPGHKNVEAYLGGWQNGAGYPDNMKVNYKDVLKDIHADESVAAKQRYEECTDPPYYALSGQDGKGVVNEVVTILEHGSKPRLLFFNGVNDFICNHVGNERMLMNLPWSHKNEWNLSKRYVWDAFPGAEEPAGYMKEYSNLSFLKVMASGHMVPMDVPDVALEMIRTFMHHGSFKSSNQNINGLILEGPGECNCNTQGNDDDGEEEEQTRRNLIAGQGVIGAAFGVMFTFFYNHVRGRGRLSKSSKRSVGGDDMTSLTSDEPYTDHPGMEMEMVKC